MLICVHRTEQCSEMTVGAHAVDKPSATNRTESCTRAACKLKHMSIPIKQQVILVGNCSFLSGLDLAILRNATAIRFSKDP